MFSILFINFKSRKDITIIGINSKNGIFLFFVTFLTPNMDNNNLCAL